MNKSANKGEWSELYALFKLLSDGDLHAGDANLNNIKNLIYPIIRIIRGDAKGEIDYEYNDCKDIVLILNDGTELARIPVRKFTENAQILLRSIKEAHTSTFEVPDIIPFREEVFASKIKADSLDKSDITIVVHDPRTGIKPKLGFSIKSELGMPPTLLNSGKTTNFIYKLTTNISQIDIDTINSLDNIFKKLKAIYQNSSLDFCGIEKSPMSGNMFYNNLVLIDTILPSMIAEMLKYRYLYNINSISEITALLNEHNPFNFDMSNHHSYYESKIKHLLTDIALGMTPAHVWNGIYDANGGYLIVKETGDIICYHIYNKKEFEDYLFVNTKLDTPSATRYKFGMIEEDTQGNQFIKLNLQIRFIK